MLFSVRPQQEEALRGSSWAGGLFSSTGTNLVEIREHVVSSGWASGCVVSQTYGRSYQRKMEITGGLGLVQSPEQSPCVCAVPDRGAWCSRTLALHGALDSSVGQQLL